MAKVQAGFHFMLKGTGVIRGAGGHFPGGQVVRSQIRRGNPIAKAHRYAGKARLVRHYVT